MAFAIILGSGYKSYSRALKTLSQEELSVRRLKLCTTFAKKCTTNPRHADMFELNLRYKNSTRKKQKYIQPKCNTTRLIKSDKLGVGVDSKKRGASGKFSF